MLVRTHCSMYLSIFNRFPVIQPVSSKLWHFSTFLHILASPWVRPWDNRGKCYIDGKRIQCWSNALQHVPIYLQPFTSYSEILFGNCNFPTPLHLMPSLGCSHWNSGKKFGPYKTRIMGLPGSEDSLTIGWAVLTQYQRVTDGRTDVQLIAITCISLLTHVKNDWFKTI